MEPHIHGPITLLGSAFKTSFYTSILPLKYKGLGVCEMP